jgi:hypothetical protein
LEKRAPLATLNCTKTAFYAFWGLKTQVVAPPQMILTKLTRESVNMTLGWTWPVLLDHRKQEWPQMAQEMPQATSPRLVSPPPFDFRLAFGFHLLINFRLLRFDSSSTNFPVGYLGQI